MMNSLKKISHVCSFKAVELFLALLMSCFPFLIPNASASGTWEEIHHVSGADWEDGFFLMNLMAGLWDGTGQL